MKEQILKRLKEILPEIDFTEEALVDDGILDSLSITMIISELSLEFSIAIPYEEIVSDNFNSVDAMAALVERLKS